MCPVRVRVHVRCPCPAFPYTQSGCPLWASVHGGSRPASENATWRSLLHDVTAINNNAVKNKKNGHYDDGYAMKRKNRKTVETRLSFAAAFSSPHPFVAFVLSESLGTRL